jgi:hypothetical protein
LGIGDWGLGIGPNPQSPIPNPQSPIPNPQLLFKKEKQIKTYKININLKIKNKRNNKLKWPKTPIKIITNQELKSSQ